MRGIPGQQHTPFAIGGGEPLVDPVGPAFQHLDRPRVRNDIFQEILQALVSQRLLDAPALAGVEEARQTPGRRSRLKVPLGFQQQGTLDRPSSHSWKGSNVVARIVVSG
jgi:hypothetical protein